MGKIVTFGELLLRLMPENNLRFSQCDSYEAIFGGTEANVAVALANFGLDVSYVTKLPDNDIGQAGINGLRKFGVDTSKIVRGGKRVGIYFCEKGISCRPSKVIYDRAYSSISEASLEDFDWNSIFEDATWFHFTGITPALSKNVAEITELACKEAKKRGITVSCDLNYRAKLWSKEQAKEVMTNLMQYVDVCISNVPQILDVFGLTAENEVALAKLVKEKYNFTYVALTDRISESASDNIYSGMIYDGENAYYSKKYNLHILDRIGGGDGFGAGLIYSLIQKFDLQKAIEFAAATAALKHTIQGDCTLVSVEEVFNLAQGDATALVQR